MADEERNRRWNAAVAGLRGIADDPQETPARRRIAQAAFDDATRASMGVIDHRRVAGGTEHHTRGGGQAERLGAEYDGWGDA